MERYNNERPIGQKQQLIDERTVENKKGKLILTKFPLYHISRCKGVWKFLWTTYNDTDTI